MRTPPPPSLIPLKIFFLGKPGLDAETKAVMRVLFSEEYMMSIFDYCGDFLGGEE